MPSLPRPFTVDGENRVATVLPARGWATGTHVATEGLGVEALSFQPPVSQTEFGGH